MIDIKSLSFRYTKKSPPVLNDISCTIPANSVIGVLGANGSGKTTFLKLLCRLLHPTSGAISSAHSITYSYLPSAGSISPQLTVKEFLTLRNARKLSQADLLTVEEFKLSDLLSKKATTLSFGQQQRVRLCASMLSQADAYLLDEPTTGLDIEQNMIFKSLIRNFATNKPILLATHNPAEILTLCTHLLVINTGAIGYYGTLDGFMDGFQSFDDAWFSHASLENTASNA